MINTQFQSKIRISVPNYEPEKYQIFLKEVTFIKFQIDSQNMLHQLIWPFIHIQIFRLSHDAKQ